jgi:hypothetical protein
MYRCTTRIPSGVKVQVTFNTTLKLEYNIRKRTDKSNINMSVYCRDTSTSSWKRNSTSNAVWLPHGEVSVRAIMTETFHECALAASNPKATGLLWFKSKHSIINETAADKRVVVCNLSKTLVHLSYYDITREAKTGSNGLATVETIISDIQQCELKSYNNVAQARASVLELTSPSANAITTVNIFVGIEKVAHRVTTVEARAVHSEQLRCGEMLCICADDILAQRDGQLDVLQHEARVIDSRCAQCTIA